MADFAEEGNRYEGMSASTAIFVLALICFKDERNYDRRSASPRGDRGDRNRSRSPIDRDRA